MTAARQLERKGIEKGRQEERLSMAKNMLEKRLEPALIQEITGLSEKAFSKLLVEA
jgi:predicted transposase/invertase (TIGR01784 family)